MGDNLTAQDEQACLHYNFDADSKGDMDIVYLGTKIVAAAKDYPEGTCFPCMGPIAKGERHRVERSIWDGKASSCRSCAACCAAMAAVPGGDWESMEKRYSIGRAWCEARRAPLNSGSAPGASDGVKGDSDG